MIGKHKKAQRFVAKKIQLNTWAVKHLQESGVKTNEGFTDLHLHEAFIAGYDSRTRERYK
jgi:hypothetical protein